MIEPTITPERKPGETSLVHLTTVAMPKPMERHHKHLLLVMIPLAVLLLASISYASWKYVFTSHPSAIQRTNNNNSKQSTSTNLKTPIKPDTKTPTGSNSTNTSTESLTKITASSKTLVNTSGQTFKVWGLNYTNINSALIEDNWSSDAGWNRITNDFTYMKSLGANTIRIHLQLNKFMTGPTAMNTTSIQNLQRLVQLAESEKLYLIVTGLAEFRKSDNPSWYDALSEQDRWATQSVFWQNVAGAIGKSPAVFNYDLMNEPAVAANPTNGWLPGNGFGGFYFVQNITLDLKGRTQAAVMQSWITTLTNAIRSKDSTTLITVGFTGGSWQSQMSGSLSAVSFHVYPKSGQIASSDSLIQTIQSNKPLVISETYPLTATTEELKQFILHNNPYVNGWVGHYLGTTLEELQNPKTIGEAITKSWLEMFKQLAPTQQ